MCISDFIFTFPCAQPLAGPISCFGIKFGSGRTLMMKETRNETGGLVQIITPGVLFFLPT